VSWADVSISYKWKIPFYAVAPNGNVWQANVPPIGMPSNRFKVDSNEVYGIFTERNIFK
jgi:hypothetical protein